MPKGSGRRPLPSAVKKLRGNPGKRPVNKAEPKPAMGEPQRPVGMSTAAIKEWKAIVPELARLGVLTKIDGKALAAYCMAWARWMEAEKKVVEFGILVEEPIIQRDHDGYSEIVGTRYKRNPAVSISNEAQKIMKAFLVEFGMTPSSRSRIRIENKPEDEDPVDAFLKGKSQLPATQRVN
jgi:P27 family predicted phage terminase small subunit